MTRVSAETTAAVDPEADLTVREQEILAVCAELLTEIGYERLTIDAVAARARASKATIYRRWPGKPALVGAAMRYITDSDNIAPQYTGDLRADLLTLLTNARDRLADKAPLLAGMVHAMQEDPELAGLLRADIDRCRATTDALLARYSAEGVITAPDPEFVRELAPATLMTRILITGEPVDDCLLNRLVDRVLMPLLSPAER
ncbi:MAG TPA: TetR/AcrR family transcriptional regulator [Sporichthyaceae bacterium]|nr:TetR/AcrR family transcriptional regulator [Sporichthyaceae bacterium]